ncbi:hypothetical protein LCI18_012245 [Fusarium solani-melongenae]|uniref:Uncharacterized protein n=1 Tax=Fusarium solani subsp. cucurbitae TaxID=2747967 RepID=A0ACD3ZJC8_FUSSC|nr:hypothetical protein LCI18_012245 [Fusarium solani-melongenae]
MGLKLGSSWSTPRGWRMISLTLFALTLLLVVPLHQLSSDSPGVYNQVSKYLKHEGTVYDVEDGFIANLNETETEQVVGGKPNGVENGSTGQQPGGAHEAQAIGEDGKEAQNTDGKPAEGQQVQGGENATGDNKPQAEGGDNNNGQGVGGPIQEGEKLETNQGSPEDNENNEDGGGEDEDEVQPVKPPKFIVHPDPKPTTTSHKPPAPTPAKENDKEKEKENHDNHENSDNKGNEDNKDKQETPNPGDKPTEPAAVEFPSNPPNPNDLCAGFPNLNGITLVMKTGATEAFSKLPAHLLTSLQCVQDVLIFSDLEQQIGSHHIIDVLDNVKEDVQKGRKEFDLYKAQKSCPIPQKYCTADMKGGWDLDKYKFLHMIERAWKLRPHQRWYVFAEADSYIFWPNLIWFLNNKVNATETPYVGSVAMLKGTPFAHGGSGYVIYGDTVRKMVEIPDLAHKYDMMATHECCGDYLMALAVNETGKKVRQAHPMFNGEKPVTLPFGNNHWCEPLITMHHMDPEEVSSVWQYEKTREKTGPIQIREMYETFFAPNLKDKRDEWDNLSDDTCFIGPEPDAQAKATDRQKGRQKKEAEKTAVQRRAHQSEELCSKVCEADGLDINEEEFTGLENDGLRAALIRKKYEERRNEKDFHGARKCFQWRYQKGICCIAKSFKQGKPHREAKPEDKAVSGWFVQGINDWITAKGECEPKWKIPS